ncbi:glycosyltransferase [uncultured Pseudacidovorax sp.]|uniref:glycosyltransferase family 2 protein n=1 Tax=uncultured Pseudacidovorax sp. TaxID=679313 RepID=UPI0025D69015|nr:glycosyltransferase [uncultured Pseudacidovorax sp.]
MITDRIDDHQMIARLEKKSGIITIKLSDISFERLEVSVIKTSVSDIAQIPPILAKVWIRDERFGRVFEAIYSKRLRVMEKSSAFIDYAYYSNGLIYLNGWLPNFSRIEVFFLSDGAAHISHSDDSISHIRSDVTNYVTSQLKMESFTDAHGFSLAIPKCSAASDVSIVIMSGGEAFFIYSGVPEVSNSAERIFPTVLDSWRHYGNTPLKKCLDLLAPFISKGSCQTDYRVQTRYSTDLLGKPALSIIIPFYKEWKFIFSVLSLARKSPENWEWIIVCDDPGISHHLSSMVLNSEDSLRRRITFLNLMQNVGFGSANNVAANEAGSAHLLLMNSDIWIADFKVIELALEEIKGSKFKIIGFTLLFEDGTIQHDGISYKRARDYDDMYLVNHPGKGLPPTFERDLPEAIECRGVTGALMLMEKQYYKRVGGFNKIYVGGDFEDADLCLSTISANEKIGLMRSRSIFHLERQSIRKDGMSGFGFARTLVNCRKFTERWSPFLDKQLETNSNA